MIGADRFHPLRAGWIGDNTSGGLMLHDSEQNATIELGRNIATEKAHELALKLDAVLKEIHEAQRTPPTWVRNVHTGLEGRLVGMLGFDTATVQLANERVVTVQRSHLRRMEDGVQP